MILYIRSETTKHKSIIKNGMGETLPETLKRSTKSCGAAFTMKRFVNWAQLGIRSYTGTVMMNFDAAI